MKTKQYPFGKDRRKTHNKHPWSTARRGFIFILLYISLQCCMAEVNQIVLPGHLTMTDYSTGAAYGKRSRRKLACMPIFVGIFIS